MDASNGLEDIKTLLVENDHTLIGCRKAAGRDKESMIGVAEKEMVVSHCASSCLVGDLFDTPCHISCPIGYTFLGELSARDVGAITSKINVWDREMASFCNHHIQEMCHIIPPKRSSVPCKGFGNTVHKKTAKAFPLPAISFYKNFQGNSIGLFPGTSICYPCRQNAIKSIQSLQLPVESGFVENEPHPKKLQLFNQILEAAGIEHLTTEPSNLRLREASNRVQKLIDTCLGLLSDEGIELDLSAFNFQTSKV